MAEDIAKLGLEIDSKGVVRATKDLDRLEKQSGETEQATDKLGTSTKNMGMKMAGAAVAVGAVAAALKFRSKLIEVNTEFDRLEASLETVTGSTEQAAAAFDMIKDFAKTTPYQLTEVTDAFIKLKALGLDPSIGALRSYGNTASAMGKSLNQMIEAVADAATGEFERLKEFGIKASVQGDQVSLRFRGVTTQIENNAGAIENYLRQIGEVEFAGGMARQMETLGGAASNLEDSFDAFARAIGEGSGFNDAVKSANGAMSDLLNTLTDLISPADDAGEALGDRLAKRLVKAREELSAVRSDRVSFLNAFGLGETFEERQAEAERKVKAIEEMIIASAIQINKEAEKAGLLPGRTEPPPAITPTAPTGKKDDGAIASLSGTDISGIRAQLEQALLTEEQLIAEHHAKHVMQVEQWISEDLTRAAEGDELIKQLEVQKNSELLDIMIQHEDEKTRIAQEQSEARRSLIAAELGAAAGIFSGLSDLMNKEGKKQSAIQKNLARASIVASTAQAVMNALAVPPYPLGLALAAGAALKGAQQLRAVSGGGGGSNTASSIQSPAGFQQDSLASNTNAQGGGTAQSVVVNITGTVLSEDIDQIIADAVRRGADTDNLVIEVNGQRAVVN